MDEWKHDKFDQDHGEEQQSAESDRKCQKRDTNRERGPKSSYDRKEDKIEEIKNEEESLRTEIEVEISAN